MTGGHTVALVGNPNSGKTTLFNRLAGARQRTGNWPGVTVERAVGAYTAGGVSFAVVDLPGIYSFTTHTLDERVAREFVLRQRPDVVVNILDAANLERSLYLTAQLLEMRVPMVVALNMTDIAERRGLRVDVAHLERHLNCPVVAMSAARGEGLDALREAIARVVSTRAVPAVRVTYDAAVEAGLARLAGSAQALATEQGVDARWLAVKSLEGDVEATGPVAPAFEAAVRAVGAEIQHHAGRAPEAVIADGRYGFIHGLARDVIRRNRLAGLHFSDLLDRLTLSRLLGVPLFLVVMYGVFWLTVRATQPLVDLFDSLGGALLVQGARVLLEALGAPPLLVALLADGVGAGLVAVTTFVPSIFVIFLCLAALEESGYMARAAFVMDHLLRRIGLPGKAFLPLLVGFGCSVPALMATRTLEQRRDRVLTMLITPFMSCGARLPVYTVFAAAFFPASGNRVVFALYLTGAGVALLSGLLLHRTLLRGRPADFVMELPPYHLPRGRACLSHAGYNLKSFVLRAGKVIVLVAVALSLLNAAGAWVARRAGRADVSPVAVSAKVVAPAFEPMGIDAGNWPAVVGLLTGLLAKESVVGTLDVLYRQVDEDARRHDPRPAAPFHLGAEIAGAFSRLAVAYGWHSDAAVAHGPGGVHVDQSAFGSLRRHFGTRASAFAYLLFVLLYSPCLAALVVLAREASWGWMWFSVTYQCSVAWIAAVAFYQAATYAQHPAGSLGWLASLTALIVVACAVMRWAGARAPLTEAA